MKDYVKVVYDKKIKSLTIIYIIFILMVVTIPFFTKSNLLQHGDRKADELEEYIPAEYISKFILQYYNDGKNFFIIEAKTGSGKSYNLPLIFFKLFVNYTTVILQPKILTVKQLEEDYTKPNSYAIKYVEKNLVKSVNVSTKSSISKLKCSDQHCILISSYGSMIKSLLENPNILKSYKVFILDEVHEDTQDVIDLLLFLYKIKKSKQLPIIILTSATIDINKYLNYFEVDNDNYFLVKGKSGLKVDKHYLEEDSLNILDSIHNILLKIIEQRKIDEKNYDVLIFVSGQNDIDSIRSYKPIVELKDNQNLMLLGLTRQNITSNSNDYREFENNNNISDLQRRRTAVIIGTNVAETGLTIYNLKYVMNIGFEVKNEYIPYLNTTILYKKPISLSSETQRNGRVGRNFDGIAYNLYTEKTKDRLNVHRVPNIVTEKFVIKLLKNIENFNYIDTVPYSLIYDSIYKLYIMGFVVTDDNTIIDSNDLYKCIIVDKENKNDNYRLKNINLSNQGLFVKNFFNVFNENDIIELNDIKLILMSYYFKINTIEIITIICMYKHYTFNSTVPLTAFKDSENDYLMLLNTYDFIISKKKHLKDKEYMETNGFYKVILLKHEIIKALYIIGLDVSNMTNVNNSSIKDYNKDNKIKYLIQYIFYNSFSDMIIENGKYRNISVDNVQNTDRKYITNEVICKYNRKNNSHGIKLKYRMDITTLFDSNINSFIIHL